MITKDELIDNLTDLLYRTSSPEDFTQSITPMIERIYSDHSQQVNKLETQIDYWKLSFHKQCEANRCTP